MATTIKVRDLRAGMKVKDGRAMRTVTAVETYRYSGGGEFEDYETRIVYLDAHAFAPGRGKVALHAEFDPEDTITVYGGETA